MSARRSTASGPSAVSGARRAMGSPSVLSSVSVERWVSASKRRREATSSPQSSIRSGAGWPKGKRSTMPPRTA